MKYFAEYVDTLIGWVHNSSIAPTRAQEKEKTMDDATYNKKELKPLIGYTLADVVVVDGILRMVFTKGKEASGVDILMDPEGNGPGYASVFHA